MEMHAFNPSTEAKLSRAVFTVILTLPTQAYIFGNVAGYLPIFLTLNVETNKLSAF